MSKSVVRIKIMDSVPIPDLKSSNVNVYTVIVKNSNVTTTEMIFDVESNEALYSMV
jgi:hypothetical protein